MHTWWNHFGSDKKGLILILKKNDSIVGIAPLMLSIKKFYSIKIRIIEFIGTGISDYGDFILIDHEEECIKSIIDFLISYPIKWDIIDLRNIPDDSSTKNIFNNAMLNRNYNVIERKSINHYIELDLTWEIYNKKLSKNRRYQLRKIENNILKEFNVVTKYANDDNKLDLLFETFFSLYKNWLTEKQKLSELFGVKISDLKNFLLEIVNIFFQNNWLDLSVIYLNRKPVSAQCNFILDKNYYYYMSGWDLGYAKYSIGNLHLMQLVKHSNDLGLEEFDFLRGDETYKYFWNTSQRANRRLIIFKDIFKRTIFKFLEKIHMI